ncbi:carboxynorspermidine decarboxylase [Prevotellaceae bacterium MN60]|nr:carboxynorspermidine decarboxylase [Prevotellaceae bacterium MN60]
MRHNLALIREVACRTNSEWILAFKAFALWKTFPIFREYINSTTASSLSEARLAFDKFGAKAHTYSPAYKDDEFDAIVACSSHLTFNSLSQYERFHERAAACSLGLRINPEYSEVETLLYNPCAPGTRFGVTADKLPEHLPQDIRGFHCHCHCESGSDVFERSLQHIEEKFSKWFSQIEWINFGGGHLVTRKDYDIERLVRIMQGFHQRYPHLKVIFEPGSAFAWQTGPLVASVVDIVEDKGIRTAILDVSFTCHMPDCLEMPYYPEVRGAQHVEHEVGSSQEPPFHLEGAGGRLYRLGGNSCLSGDWMGYWQFNHELIVGEQIIFEDMIHYTTVKTNTFNGITHPSIAMQHSDGSLELLRRFTYEDYRDRMD